jgi:hypothetical protein
MATSTQNWGVQPAVARWLSVLRFLSTTLLVSVALGCAAGTAVGGSESTTKASLQVIGQAPMTIQGRGFRSQESVRVSAAGRQWRLRAGPRGSFVLTLRGTDPCRIVRIVAVGSAGSRAILRIMPLRQCPGAPNS